MHKKLIQYLYLSVQVFIACGVGLKSGAVKMNDDAYRKPKPGMWHLMEQHFNSGIVIDMDRLFFLHFNSSIDAMLFLFLLFSNITIFYP